MEFFLNRIPSSIARIAQGVANSRKFAKSTKIFCIGRNKTGTTSMAKLLESLGFELGPQREFEHLLDDLVEEDYTRIFRKVKYRGVAFQDVPFSIPDIYKHLDREFENSKFILTVRDSADAWYQSLTRFHSKKFGDGKLPDKRILENAEYVHKGWMWKFNRLVYSTPENDIYNEEILKKHYLDYNAEVIRFFEKRPGKLLVVNLKDESALRQIGDFLDVDNMPATMPWVNKTSDQ